MSQNGSFDEFRIQSPGSERVFRPRHKLPPVQQMDKGAFDEIKNVLRVSDATVDGRKWIIVNVMTRDISDDDWKTAKKLITRRLAAMHTTQTKYHFMFDVHEIPLDRLPSFQRLLSKNMQVLEDCLHSTAIVTQSVLLHSAMQLALQVYTPVRPLNFFYKEPTDVVGSAECEFVPERVMSQVKAFFDRTH